jgi:hypothetical protein
MLVELTIHRHAATL